MDTKCPANIISFVRLHTRELRSSLDDPGKRANVGIDQILFIWTMNSLKYLGRGLRHLWVKYTDDMVINVSATISTSTAPVVKYVFYWCDLLYKMCVFHISMLSEVRFSLYNGSVPQPPPALSVDSTRDFGQEPQQQWRDEDRASHSQWRGVWNNAS